MASDVKKQQAKIDEAEWIRRVVEGAPPLTDEQAVLLRRVFLNGRTSGGRS